MSRAVESEHIVRRFRRLIEQWKSETSHLSLMQDRAMHPAYQRIIGMGRDAVPLLLNELKSDPDDWFWALSAITEENPIPVESEGRFRQMCEAWMQWGRERGYVD